MESGHTSMQIWTSGASLKITTRSKKIAQGMVVVRAMNQMNKIMILALRLVIWHLRGHHIAKNLKKIQNYKLQLIILDNLQNISSPINHMHICVKYYTLEENIFAELRFYSTPMC